MNGTTPYMPCRGGNLPPATWQKQPVRVNGTTPYTVQCSGVDPTPLQPRRGAGTVGCYGYKRPTSGLTANGGRLPPLQWVYHIIRCTIHPHGLYIQRGGRQVAAPTIHLLQITAFLTYLSSFFASKISKTWYIDVGAATCRPPRGVFNPTCLVCKLFSSFIANP